MHTHTYTNKQLNCGLVTKSASLPSEIHGRQLKNNDTDSQARGATVSNRPSSPACAICGRGPAAPAAPPGFRNPASVAARRGK
jgi:hypothetical protein